MNVYSYNCCKTGTIEFKNLASLSKLLKLVAESNRLKLLCLLSYGKHCGCEIPQHFKMSQSLISHHLADLKTAGLVDDQKNGRQVFYILTAKGQRVLQTLFLLKGKDR